MSFDYDKYASNGEYVKFETPGDVIVGIIKTVREGADFKGNPCPELVLEDDAGTERIVTAQQVMLKAELAEKRPSEGDKVRITYTADGDAKPGKAPAKLFTVDVKPGPHELAAPAVGDDAPF